MKRNFEGFSVMVGMGLVILITLGAYLLLGYMIPFSKNVKGIENSANAYYISYGGIEKALYFVTKTRPNLVDETSQAMTNQAISSSYATTSTGNMIPQDNAGNSEFDKNFNIISQSEPLQLEVGRKSHNIPNLSWANINFIFKVPDMLASAQTLSGNTLPIINWMLSSTEDTLTASGSYIQAGQINNSKNTTNTLQIDQRYGSNLNSTGSIKFQDFYDTNCNGVSSGCVLKMSVLNTLELNSSQPIPYLEYKIVFPNTMNFPNRYTQVKASGKSYGFQKNLEVQIPQQTINQALDFTVFQ